MSGPIPEESEEETMDGLTVAALCRDWQAAFGGARVDKIHQPSEREVVLTVRSREGTVRLLLSAHRALARAHRLVRARPTNPAEAPMFCMMLRRRLEGGRIRAIRQPGWDRALHLHIDTIDEIGDVRQLVLVLEIMGKHSNLLLCEADPDGTPVRVVDSIVHVTPEMSRVRPVLPGAPYTPPPPLPRRPYQEIQAHDIAALGLRDLPERRRLAALAGLVAGMGPVTAREVLHRAGPELDPEAIRTALIDVFEAALTGREAPSVGLDELGRPAAAAPFTLMSYERHQTLGSLDDALDLLYHDAIARAQTSALQRELTRTVQDHIDRLRGKLTKLAELETESQGYEELRIKGELLTTYAHQIVKGQTEVELPNYYDEMRPIRIELDPSLTAIENAQRYFKQSSKRKRAIPIVAAERAQTEEDLRYLEDVLVHLRDATPAHLEAIRRELEQQGFLSRPQRRRDGQRGTRRAEEGRKTSASAAAPDAFISQDGFVIRVGRNNAQNDRLTLRWSQPHDVWLHVKDLPGSHVVIRTEGREVPEATLEEAALLAAYFSKARDSSQVAVDYTRVKDVWKPKGARPGHVLYEGHRTLVVTPDRSRIEPLLARRARGRADSGEQPSGDVM